MSSDEMAHAEDPEAPEVLRRIPSRLLAMAAGHADRLVSAGLSEVDAHKWHYAVLLTLRDAGPASQATLSRRTGIYRSDMVSVLNELEERSYVKRALDPDDRRRNVITLTQPGLRRLAKLETVIAGLQDELLAPLTAKEREKLIELLGRVVAHHSG